MSNYGFDLSGSGYSGYNGFELSGSGYNGFELSGGGPGSYIGESILDDDGDDDYNEKKYENVGILVLVPMAPFIMGCCGICLLCLCDGCIDPISSYFNRYPLNLRLKINNFCKKIKNFFNFMKCNKIEEHNFINNLPIVDSKLNPVFINDLYNHNEEKVKEKESLECTICLDTICLEDYEKTKSQLVFLNCIHVFHTECIQPWVKSQVQTISVPNCPTCRRQIANIPETKITITYDSDDSFSDFD
jgi:hypothetical protein